MKKNYFKGLRSGNYVQVKINTDRLDEIQSTLVSRYITRVGILGSKTQRHPSITTRSSMRKAGRGVVPQTNAEIGLLHEKGSLSLHIPRRSFLEMPLVLKSDKLLAVRKELMNMVNVNGGETLAKWKHAYKMLGFYAENIIQSAFESRGFGHWAPDSQATIRRKGSDMPLIDTGQLRRSITSDVVSK